MGTLIEVARGISQADLLVKNAQVYNPFIREFEEVSFAIYEGRVAGVGTYKAKNEIDLKGLTVSPGFIDAHVHIESSLLVPQEYARLVLSHGTTTIVADPHEIANVCGITGIEFMCAAGRKTPLDILYTLPSCVPATPLDECAEPLSATHLAPLSGWNDIIGLGEMMNVPGVLNESPDVMKKLSLSNIRDGHAPFLSGHDLQAYISAGIQSDHETIALNEGKEKLRGGMYLFLREGSTEHNLIDLLPLVSPATVGRCSFCTDDRHADLLKESGHIDYCIRIAIAQGLEPELAYLMATLSPADRFGLSCRGALSPGRRADFCVLDNVKECHVIRTFILGKEVTNIPYSPPEKIKYQFRTRNVTKDEITINGSGKARVIGIIPNQIATNALEFNLDCDSIPDFRQDILKVVVASRYNENLIGVGLVHGLKMQEGAIASSVAHDSHHLIAAGVSDEEILAACREIIRCKGGMTCVYDNTITTLPLPCAGLMAELPYEEVCEGIGRLNAVVEQIGAIDNPFMYLSFLSLTVIPALRITPNGLFDGSSFAHVPLFIQ